MLDSSAMVAILLKEPGCEDLLEKVGRAPGVAAATPTLVETGLVLMAKTGKGSRSLLSLFVSEAGLALVPFGEAHWRAAADAFWRYGKGRHRAALNFGDCMAYATAKLAREPLLCVGTNFVRTDLELA
ncbi:MAG: type II toxin-antitoxin system VapC family toxin [Thermoanaerobaculia bacterium]